jgi:hypothetical protein
MKFISCLCSTYAIAAGCAAAAAAIAWLGYKLSVTAARERNLFETNGAYIADEKNARVYTNGIVKSGDLNKSPRQIVSRGETRIIVRYAAHSYKYNQIENNFIKAVKGAPADSLSPRS